MKVINLGESNSILNRYVAELRDKEIQKESLRFRRNLERIGEIFAYEISKTLDYAQQDVITPLGIAKCSMPQENYISAQTKDWYHTLPMLRAEQASMRKRRYIPIPIL